MPTASQSAHIHMQIYVYYLGNITPIAMSSWIVTNNVQGPSTNGLAKMIPAVEIMAESARETGL